MLSPIARVDDISLGILFCILAIVSKSYYRVTHTKYRHLNLEKIIFLMGYPSIILKSSLQKFILFPSIYNKGTSPM